MDALVSPTTTTLVSPEVSIASNTSALDKPSLSPSPNTLGTDDPGAAISENGSGSSAGSGVLGGILGGVAFLTVLALLALWTYRRRRRTSASRPASSVYGKEKGISSKEFFPLENIPSNSSSPNPRSPATPGSGLLTPTSATPFTAIPPRSPGRAKRNRLQKQDLERQQMPTPEGIGAPSIVDQLSAARTSSDIDPTGRASADTRRSRFSHPTSRQPTPLSPLSSRHVANRVPAHLPTTPPLPSHSGSPTTTAPVPPTKAPPSAFPLPPTPLYGMVFTESRPGSSMGMSVMTSTSRPISTILGEPTLSEPDERMLQFEGNREAELQERRAQWLRLKYFEDVMSGQLQLQPGLGDGQDA